MLIAITETNYHLVDRMVPVISRQGENTKSLVGLENTLVGRETFIMEGI